MAIKIQITDNKGIVDKEFEVQHFVSKNFAKTLNYKSLSVYNKIIVDLNFEADLD